MTVRKSLALVLMVAAVGLLAWRLWPDSAQARRHQRDRDLVQAVQHNDLSAATRLLAEGADPNGYLPPLGVTQKMKVDYFFLSRGAKMPSWGELDKASPRWSLLEMAAFLGNADMTSALLRSGADVGYRDKRNHTALTLMTGAGGISRSGSDYPRVLALLKAANAQTHHAGNKQ